MTKKILIVDDEEDILELIRYNLEKEGYSITTATSGESAVRLAGSASFDLIVLDLMLPGIDGLEVAKKLRKKNQTENIPIIMLTAKGEESDILTGLELGADDYVTKPFSPKVLAARIKSVLRRKDKKLDSDDYCLNLQGFVIDSGRREVTVHGMAIDLTYSEFEILFFLATHPGWVFSRNQIVDAVRGEGYAVTDRSVDVQVAGIRKKLGNYGKYIETVRGVGYRFMENPS